MRASLATLLLAFHVDTVPAEDAGGDRGKLPSEPRNKEAKEAEAEAESRAPVRQEDEGGLKRDRRASSCTIGFVPGSGFVWRDGRTSGMGHDLPRMAQLLQNSEEAILQIDRHFPRETLRRLIETYRSCHGFHQEFVLKRRRPDERFSHHEARISIDKESYTTEEPILLTLEIEGPGGGAPWQLFCPRYVRVQDSEDEEVNLFVSPVTDTDGSIRSKCFGNHSKGQMDLTSFIELSHGIEYVYRFRPGRYIATFHFSAELPDLDNRFRHHNLAYSRLWGERHSNTVSFTVSRPKRAERPDTADLFAHASEMVAADRANDAVKIYKRIVWGSDDQPTIQRAIRQILRVRRCALYDDPLGSADWEADPLADYLDALRKKAEERGRRGEEDYLEIDVRRLSLLHTSAEVREEWCRGRYRGEQLEGAEMEYTRPDLLWSSESASLFHYPQFRSILDRELQRPAECPIDYLAIALCLPGRKSPKFIEVFLERSPGAVLQHYRKHKAPLEIAALFPPYFEDLRGVSGNREYTITVADEALAAFEKAKGLDLGLPSYSVKGMRERARLRKEIRALLRHQ